MSKTFFNDNLLPKVTEIIDEFKRENKETFLTSEVIKKQIGKYISDNCQPNDAFNANFGKFLKNNENVLGIKEIAKKVSIKDDCGNETCCSKWQIL